MKKDDKLGLERRYSALQIEHHDMERALLHKFLYDNGRQQKPEGNWAPIPLGMHEFDDAMGMALEINPRAKTFLDVGSGIGSKVSHADRFWGLQSQGIEMVPEIAEISRHVAAGSVIHNINAFDFTKYDQYDIIYYYQPMHDYKKQMALEHLIEIKAKVGAIILPFLKVDRDFYKGFYRSRFKVHRIPYRGEVIEKVRK